MAVIWIVGWTIDVAEVIWVVDWIAEVAGESSAEDDDHTNMWWTSLTLRTYLIYRMIISINDFY